MKKQVSFFTLAIGVAIALWQTWTDSPLMGKTTQNNATQNISTESGSKAIQTTSNTATAEAEKGKSAVKNADIFADYDVNMHNDAIGQNAHAPTDYYMLVLSWSPSFCAEQQRKYGDLPLSSQYQCSLNRQFGWVVHGLWPQNAAARTVADHPRFCRGDLAPLPPSLLEKYLDISPGATLLQGEWEKHGACAFDSADAYFAKQKALFAALKLPPENLPRNELFRWLRQHNPSLKHAYLGAGRNELYICYDKNWAVTDCPKKR